MVLRSPETGVEVAKARSCKRIGRYIACWPPDEIVQILDLIVGLCVKLLKHLIVT